MFMAVRTPLISKALVNRAAKVIALQIEICRGDSAVK